MKKILLLLIVFGCLFSLLAQAPQGFNYQAVARNPDTKAPITTGTINVGFIIHDNGPAGTVLYQESHLNVAPNALGLFNLTIGKGQVNQGNFSTINWASGTKFLEVLIDGAPAGTQQLQSIPYALHAKTVENAADADADPQNELQQLSQNGNTISLSRGGGTVTVVSGAKGYSNTPSVGFGSGITFNVIESVTFTLSDTAKIYVQADVAMWGNGSPCVGAIKLNFDGADENRTLTQSDNPVSAFGNNKITVATSWMTTLSPGQHTVNLKAGGWQNNCSIFKHPHLNVLVLDKE